MGCWSGIPTISTPPHDGLKAAEAQNNPELIVKYAELAWDLASRTL